MSTCTSLTAMLTQFASRRDGSASSIGRTAGVSHFKRQGHHGVPTIEPAHETQEKQFAPRGRNNNEGDGSQFE